MEHPKHYRGIVVGIAIVAIIVVFVFSVTESIARTRQAAGKTELLTLKPETEAKPTVTELTDDCIDTLKEYIGEMKKTVLEK